MGLNYIFNLEYLKQYIIKLYIYKRSIYNNYFNKNYEKKILKKIRYILMEKIINLNPIRSKRKVLTAQEPEELKKTKIKNHSQSTPKSKSLSEKVLLSPTSNDENIKKSKNKKVIITKSELNLNELVPLEYVEFPPPGSGKKPNFISKSLFFTKRDYNINYYQNNKKKQSPIFQYYDNSSFVEQVKNERLNNINNNEGNNFSFFMKQMKNEENFDNNMENINENEEILGFNKDSSSDDDDDDYNSHKLSSFVQEVLKNNERQEESNNKKQNYNHSFGFDFNDNCNSNYNEDNYSQTKSDNMNVNININNNSSNNNYYYYQFNKQNNENEEKNNINQNNNFQINNNPYKKSISQNYFPNQMFINNNLNENINNKINNNNMNNNINNNINNINIINNKQEEMYPNIYYNSPIRRPQINYYQQFINTNNVNPMNYYYNPYNQNYNNNFINYNNINNPFRSNSSNNITEKLTIHSPIRKNYNINYLQLSNEELAKQAHNIAKIQSGCRYLEKKIEDNPELVESLFFNNILSYVEELSTDQFGNYFIKKMFNYLQENKLLQLIAIIFPVIKNIATNLYGTRVLQELIDYLKSEKLLFAFIKILIPHISILINDSNSVHIIYKLINIDNPLIDKIHNSICFQIENIGTNRKGCTFLKKYFETMKLNKVEEIIKAIEKNLMNIITNQYGNYLIQTIVLFENEKLKENIINDIAKNICFYSNQKFSSNVVEKCFDDDFIKNKFIEQMLIEDNFKIMLLDNFGNYVVQKAIISSNEETKEKFFKMIIPLIPQLQKLTFGQKLLSKLLIQHQSFSLYMLNINP